VWRLFIPRRPNFFLLNADAKVPEIVIESPRFPELRVLISFEFGHSDASDAREVAAKLQCTGATSTQQSVVFTATTDAILFVYNISQIPEGQQVDCTVTEDVPANYVATYDCHGEDCGDSGQDLTKRFYPDVEPNETRKCTITNTPKPAIVTITKTWIIEGADQGFDGGHTIFGICDSLLYGPADNTFCAGPFCAAWVEQEEALEGSMEYEFTIVKPNYPFTLCNFGELHDDSVIDSDNGCGEQSVAAGASVACEIVNTVFFEGIPTLNQYGMAVLALLMLGVGFVGFRRLI
jgi:hypothetical protein